MFSEQIELRGHIIDSLTLPKVLDEILTNGGTFTIREVKIGKQRHDASYACIDVFGPSPEVVDNIVRRLRQHGAEVAEQKSVQLEPAPADGVFPPGFYVSTNHPTFVHHEGKWLEAQPVTMDCGIAVDPESNTASTVKFFQVRQGMLIAVGHHGIRVTPVERRLIAKVCSNSWRAGFRARNPRARSSERLRRRFGWRKNRAEDACRGRAGGCSHWSGRTFRETD